MVNEVSYDHVGRTSPNEQLQEQTGFVTNKAGLLQRNNPPLQNDPFHVEQWPQTLVFYVE